jgi:hypothetical protein
MKMDESKKNMESVYVNKYGLVKAHYFAVGGTDFNIV